MKELGVHRDFRGWYCGGGCDAYHSLHRLKEAVPLLDRLEGTGYAMIAREFGVYVDILATARVPVAGVLRVSDLPQRGIGHHDSIEKKGVAREQAGGTRDGPLAGLLAVRDP